MAGAGRIDAADQTVRQQLGRLFGESLFGAWPDSHAVMAPGHRTMRGRRVRRTGVVLLLALLTTSGIWVYRRGDNPQADQGRNKLAAEVAALLADGDLDRLTQALSRMAPLGNPLAADDPHLDLIVSAEAALYRYQDAAPGRLARIEPFLSHDSAQPARLLARLTIASRPERAAAQEVLLKLPPSHAAGSEYHVLLATVHEERGDVRAARGSWEHSLAAGPQWLPHRYLQCAFEARQRNPEAAARIAGHMTRVAPDSAWTRMAQQHFADSPPTTGALPAPPVAQHLAELFLVLQSLATHNLTAARQALGRALAAVDNQAAFVLDVFTTLRNAKAGGLAMELTSYEAWPRGNTWARNALSELQASLDDPSQAATPPSTRPGTETASRKTRATGAKKKVGGNTGPAKKAGKTKTQKRRGRK